MVTKYQQAYNYLNQQAASWPVNEKLPTIKELASAAGVSLSTMQKAVTMLSEEGKLRPVPGSGLFVEAYSENRQNELGVVSSGFMGTETELVVSINEPVPWMRNFWEQAAEMFEQQTPGVRVSVKLDCDGKLNPEQIDLFLCSQEVLLEQIHQGNVLECEPYVDWDQMGEPLVDNLLESVEFNSKYWAVPIFFNAGVVIFSNEALKMANISSTPENMTLYEWNELLVKASQKMKIDLPEWTKPVATNIGYQPWLNKYRVILTNSGKIDKSERNCDNWLQAIKEIKSTRSNCLGFPQVMGSSLSPFDALRQDKILGLTTSIPCRGYHDKHNWSLSRMPEIKTPVSAGFVAMSKFTRFPIQAGEFMTYLISPENQELMANNSRIPLYREIIHSDSFNLPAWINRQNLLKILDNSELLFYRNYNDRILTERIVNPLICNNILLRNESKESVIQKIMNMGQHYLQNCP